MMASWFEVRSFIGRFWVLEVAQIIPVLDNAETELATKQDYLIQGGDSSDVLLCPSYAFVFHAPLPP